MLPPNGLIVTLPRFMGIHVGDGTFWDRLRFPKPHFIRFDVRFTMTDRLTNQPMLYELRRMFDQTGVVDKNIKKGSSF